MVGDNSLLPGAKDYQAESIFTPENLLREARRQKAIPPGQVPPVCVLDPDGDIVRAFPDAPVNPYWACYHTVMHDIPHGDATFGVVGCAVGASFAVLVAEQLFASGCRLLISVTSAGQIAVSEERQYFILIDRALRDEGTSLHYRPPSPFADAEPGLADGIVAGLTDRSPPVRRGATWTTDAPFRETAAAIDAARAAGVLAVEMESAALYAFAAARGRPVICFAHVTNQMATVEGDFEKGAANGAHDAIDLIAATARAWTAMA